MLCPRTTTTADSSLVGARRVRRYIDTAGRYPAVGGALVLAFWPWRLRRRECRLANVLELIIEYGGFVESADVPSGAAGSEAESN